MSSMTELIAALLLMENRSIRRGELQKLANQESASHKPASRVARKRSNVSLVIPSVISAPNHKEHVEVALINQA